jgi:hypothetical protein
MIVYSLNIAQEATCCPVYKICKSATKGILKDSTLHIHVIGDGKAGKSVMVKWLIELLQNGYYGTDYFFSKTHHMDIDMGRTRGVEIISLKVERIGTGKEAKPEHRNYIIYDYGGQEEFLMSHANFLGIANSVYILVTPTAELSYADDKTKGKIPIAKVKPVEEIVNGFQKWLQYLFSIVKKDWRYEIVEERCTSTKSTDANAPTSMKKIPLLLVVNQFTTYLQKQEIQSIAGLKDSMQARVEAVYPDDFELLSPFPLIIDNNTKASVNHNLFPILENVYCAYEFHQQLQPAGRVCKLTGFANQKITELRRGNQLPLVLNEVEWTMKLQTIIKSNFSFPSYFTTLSTDTQNLIISGFASYCEQYFLRTKQTLEFVYTQFKNEEDVVEEKVNDSKRSIITSPNALTSQLMGDLIFWSVSKKMVDQSLQDWRVKESDILQRLKEVHDLLQKTKTTTGSGYNT